LPRATPGPSRSGVACVLFSPLITMKVIGVDGGLAVEQAVSLAALRAGS
jgi:hypothetical protein